VLKVLSRTKAVPLIESTIMRRPFAQGPEGVGLGGLIHQIHHCSEKGGAKGENRPDMSVTGMPGPRDHERSASQRSVRKGRRGGGLLGNLQISQESGGGDHVGRHSLKIIDEGKGEEGVQHG